MYYVCICNMSLYIYFINEKKNYVLTPDEDDDGEPSNLCTNG